MINPMRKQPTRMMGLASGMDTDFIIQQTLRMHQFKIDNVTRNKKLIEWKQQTQNGIKDEINSLRGTFLSNLGSKTMMNRNVFNATKATITGKNAGAVSVSTLTGTPTGSIKINQVVSLAKGASLTSGSSVSQGGVGFNPNARLDSLDFLNGGKIDFGDPGDYKASVTDVSGKSKTITQAEYDAAVTGFDDAKIQTQLTFGGKTYDIIKDKESDNIQIFDGATEITDFSLASGSTHTFTIGGQSFTMEKGSDGAISLSGQTLNFYQEVTIGTGDDAVSLRRAEGTTAVANNNKALEFIGETSITINDKTVTINSNDTIATMLNKVNTSGAGVTMSYNRLTDRFSIEHNTIGSTTGDLVVTGTGNILDLFSGSGPVATNGSKAVVIIDGETVESDRNTIDYRGLRITLNSITEENDEDTVVTFTRDATPAFNAIKDFIDSYNSIIRRLEGLLNERKGTNEAGYKPLTDEEKQGMTDKQIEEWEAIARKGIMRGDNNISNLVSSLRRSFFENIEGMGISASQIGLTTGAHHEGTGGQIMINEERLRAALESDPDRVADIFVKIDTSSGTAKGVGLLHKIDGLMRDFVNTAQPVSIKSLEDSMKRANEQIQRLQDRMFAEEDKLYRQFAAMETAMQKLNQQGGWFSAMLGQ